MIQQEGYTHTANQSTLHDTLKTYDKVKQSLYEIQLILKHRKIPRNQYKNRKLWVIDGDCFHRFILIGDIGG